MGSPYGGLGASRSRLVSSLAEPTFILVFFAVGFISAGTVGFGVQLPLGPVRSGPQESAEFLFNSGGEDLVLVSPLLGYKMRAVEQMAEGRTPEAASGCRVINIAAPEGQPPRSAIHMHSYVASRRFCDSLRISRIGHKTARSSRPGLLRA